MAIQGLRACGSHATEGGGRRQRGRGGGRGEPAEREPASGRRASWLAPRPEAKWCAGLRGNFCRRVRPRAPRRLRARAGRASRQPQVVPAKSFCCTSPGKEGWRAFWVVAVFGYLGTRTSRCLFLDIEKRGCQRWRWIPHFSMRPEGCLAARTRSEEHLSCGHMVKLR